MGSHSPIQYFFPRVSSSLSYRKWIGDCENYESRSSPLRGFWHKARAHSFPIQGILGKQKKAGHGCLRSLSLSF